MKMWKIDHRHLRRLLFLRDICWLPWILHLIFHCVDGIGPSGGGGGGGGSDLWPIDRPDGMPSIQSLEVMCGKDHMDVHLSFSQPFEGIVSSKGQHGDPRCIYVHPSSGRTYFSFRIAYARCGTKPDLHGQFYENTVVVQYDKDLLEVWDEAKRLRCEWFNDYEKTASKPPMVIADLDVVQLDFRGDNVDCWMEIQHGKGPWAPPVSGIVPLGSTLTLVVAINDFRGEFDMRVKSCVASDGAGHVIQLSDEFGCVLRPKMISRFLKAKGADERASVITYAFFHAFKFPDALSVHIKCKVEICRHGCLEHCQLQPHRSDIDLEISHYLSNEENGPSHIDRQDNDVQDTAPSNSKPASSSLPSDSTDDNLYDDNLHSDESEETAQHQKQEEKPMLVKGERFNNGEEEDDEFNEALASLMPQQDALTLNQEPQEASIEDQADLFPHGPRYFEQLKQENDEYATGTASIGGPRSFPDESAPVMRTAAHAHEATNDSKANQSKRRRRSIVIADRKARSTDVGVSGIYEVISEADLAFSPDSRAEAVTVFQGKIREEVVYGICMPVPGFSALFIMVAISAVVSALIAGSLLYRYQMQKEHMAVVERDHSSSAATPTIPMSAFVNWVGAHLMRMRVSYPTTNQSQSVTALNSDICETSVDAAVSAVVNGTANGQVNVTNNTANVCES